MKRLAAGLALIAAVPAAAQDAPPQPWEGVWQGTLGTYPVRLCLSQRSETWSVGAYYYLSQLKTIALERQDDGAWVEKAGRSDAVTGRWTLRASGNGLSGEWQQGAKNLPLALTRVPADIADGACGTREVLAPRIQPVKLREAPKTLGKFAYRELTWDAGRGFPDVSLTSLAYAPVQPGDRAINAALRLDPARREGEADYVSCYQGSLGSLGTDGDFRAAKVPTGDRQKAQELSAMLTLLLRLEASSSEDLGIAGLHRLWHEHGKILARCRAGRNHPVTVG